MLGGLKLEIGFEWSPTGFSIRTTLFLICVNDLDDDITSKVLKFADDTKVFRKIKSDADRQHLLDGLRTFTAWSEKWQILFNLWKWEGTVLNATVRGKDLTVTADMKVSEQCGIAASKGNQSLQFIARNIE